MDIGNMTPEEIISKVKAGEIEYQEYHSFAEYLKGMES